MGEISVTQHPASILDRFTYNRFNDSYQPLHAFCRLFMEGGSLSERSGPVGFETFLIDMNALFEKYLTQVLREAAAGREFSVLDQEDLRLDFGRHVKMRPDIAVTVGPQWRLIADCKYKKLDSGDYVNHDLYQVLAYCTAASVDRGILIYPRHIVPAEAMFAVQNSEVVVHQISVSLDGSIADLQEAGRSVSNRIFALAAAGRSQQATPVAG